MSVPNRDSDFIAVNKDYKGYEEYNHIEMHFSQIKSLKEFVIEIGLSSNVFEIREGECYIRELKVV